MFANQRILGFLGRALSHELSAVQQYLVHAQLAARWGDDHAAQYFRDEAAHEQAHAQAIIDTMIACGAAPAASMLSPARVGGNLRELLEADLVLERKAVELYTSAATYSAQIGAGEAHQFFAALLGEEREHVAELTAQLQRDAATRPPTAFGGMRR